MDNDSGTGNKYAKARHERQKHVDAILNSPAKKKIVTAGPGTGKTHLFQKVLEGKKKTLTLTFVNSLVEDLSLELCGLSEVKTLHSFARSALKSAGVDVKVFPKLSQVIREDAKLFLNEAIDFDHLFHNRIDESQLVQFYIKRRDYYSYYGYSDVLFSAVQHFESQSDKIPSYDQVLVDEFQDFNKLEVSLIDLLAQKSPILLAGDDDQALYVFKSASTEYIRQRHNAANGDYTAFNLPYCSRCTRVIVEAANEIITAAKENGCLNGRIDKPFLYFEDEKKDKESNQYPKITYKRLFATQIPWYIEKAVGDIAREVRGKFSVLIISPTKVKSHAIVTALKSKGFEAIDSIEKKDDKEPSLLDGLRILLDDNESNLGWRIVSKFVLQQKEFEAALKESCVDDKKGMRQFIDAKEKKQILGMLKTLRAIREDKEIEKEEFDKFLGIVGIDHYGMAQEALKEKINSAPGQAGNPANRKIPIKVTTVQSSKGLAAEYVFITYFDDRSFIKDSEKKKISDHDICNFLVALTRARRKVFLISSDNTKHPTFFEWISRDRIEGS